jgi:hypothetical protein
MGVAALARMESSTLIPSLLAVSTLLAACGGSPSVRSSSGGDPGDVTGTVVNRYLLADGSTVMQALDLSACAVQAFVQSGADWTTLAGVGKADGSFRIPGVPEGPYVLSVPCRAAYLYTSARVTDLGSDVLGRPDAVHADMSPSIAGHIQGLGAWAASDSVQWVGFNAGGAANGFETMNMPNVGDTSLQGQAAPWIGGLLDGSKGDVLYVTQLEDAPPTSGCSACSIVTHVATFPDVEQKDGVVTTVTGAFGPVPPTESITLDFRASQFAAFRQAVNPMAIDGGSSLSIGTVQGESTDASTFGATLLAYSGSGTDTQIGPIPYANPFPMTWGEDVWVAESASVSFTIPGVGSPVRVFGGAYLIEPRATAAAGPIQPLVSPVQQPEIDGESAFGASSGTSTTPTLTWKAPAIGTPSGYQVIVWQAMGTYSNTVTAILVTTDTSVALPPGMLEHGSAYYFQITAMVTSADLATHPFGPSATIAGADVLTSAITP